MSIADSSQHIIKARQFLMAGELVRAEQAASAAISTDSASAEAHQLLGLVAYYRKSFAQAIHFLQQAVALAPNVAEHHIHLGAALGASGNQDAAAEAFGAAIALQPDRADAHYNLGKIRRLQDDLPAATNCFQRAVELDPNYAEAFFNLANTLRDQEDWQQAEDAFKQAIAVRPNYAKALNNLGSMLIKRERPAEAIGPLGRAIEIRPDYVGSMPRHTTTWATPIRRWAIHRRRPRASSEVRGDRAGHCRAKRAVPLRGPLQLRCWLNAINSFRKTQPLVHLNTLTRVAYSSSSKLNVRLNQYSWQCGHCCSALPEIFSVPVKNLK